MYCSLMETSKASSYHTRNNCFQLLEFGLLCVRFFGLNEPDLRHSFGKSEWNVITLTKISVFYFNTRNACSEEGVPQ